MAKLQMTGAGASAQPAPLSLAHSASPSPTPQPPPPIPNVGSIDSVRQEVYDAYEDARSFFNREPDEVIRLVSGHCARLSFLRTVIGEVEAYDRRWRPIYNSIGDCLEELRNQFNYASRLLFSRELDFKIEGSGRIT